MHGWQGKILRVDLTSEAIDTEPTINYATDFLGGSGIGAKILYNEVPPDVKPFDAKSRVIIATGPLNGVVPSSGRGEVVFKSPVTGWYADSNFGGFFTVELKLAGFDAVVIQGTSKKPVYLWICDDHAELKDASHLWGKDTIETEEIIRKDHDDPMIRTLKIGPAGENLVYGACLIGDEGRAAGRLGGGAVVGSKKLKAIAVRGTKEISVANPEELEKMWLELIKRFENEPVYEYFSQRGTVGVLGDVFVSSLGSKYIEKLHSDIYLEKIFTKTSACYGCPLRCSHWHLVKEGPYKGTYAEGLEFNTHGNYGIFLRTLDPYFISAVDAFCDRTGIGVDEPYDLLLALMRMYEDERIGPHDVDGLDLSWGNKEAIMSVLEKYVRREGIGNVLANGPQGVIEKFKDREAEKYVPTYNKNTFGRGALVQGTGFGLAICTSTRGADYLKGAPPERLLRLSQTKPRRVANITEEQVRKLGQERYDDPEIFLDIYGTKGKVKMVIAQEHVYTLCDATGVCKYASWGAMYVTGIRPEDFANLLTVVTGRKYTVENLVVIADRINAIQRAYNAREGKRRDEEPFELRVGWKQPIDSKAFNELLDEYYERHGFNKDGIPTRKTLEKLRLKDVVNDLERHGVPLE